MTQEEWEKIKANYFIAYEAANEKPADFDLLYQNGWVRFSDKSYGQKSEWKGFRVSTLQEMTKNLWGRAKHPFTLA